MATRIKSNQIEDNTIVAADLHSAIAINTTASGTFGSVTSSGTIAGSNTISTSSSNGFVINNIGRMKMDSNNLYLETETNGTGIVLNSRTGFVTFQNNGSTAFQINNSNNATFQGTISSGAITASGTSTFATSISAGTTNNTDTLHLYKFQADHGIRIQGSSANWYIYNKYSDSGKLHITDNTSQDTITVDTSGNITISGTINSGNITTTGYLAGPSTFTIDPAAVGDNTGTVVIAGNLQVDGTTTTINSTTMTVDDKNITLASGAANSAAANGAGITVDGASATIIYDSTNDEWDFNKDINVTGTISSGAITSTGDITTGYAKTISMNYAPSSGDYHKGMSGLNQSSGTARGLHLFNYDNDSNEGIKFWVGTNASRSQALHIADNTNATFAGNISSGAITSSSTIQGTAYLVGSTVIVNTNRDLTNIGTISSGAITSNVTGNNNVLVLTRDTGTNGRLEIDFDGAFTNFNSTQGGFDFSFAGSSPLLRIDYTGNVGIGTGASAPGQKLTVAGGHIKLDAGYSLQWSDSHERIEQSDGHLEFFVNNGEAMTLDTNGLVIGTTTTDNGVGRLTVRQTPGAPATSGSTASNLGFRITTNTSNSQALDFGVYSSGAYGSWIQAVNSGDHSSNYPILLNPNGGNVGIGTDSPTLAMLQFGINATANRLAIKTASDRANGIGLASYSTITTRYSNWDTLIGTNVRSQIGTSSSGEQMASSYTASGAAGLRIGFQDLEFKNYHPTELSGLTEGDDVTSLGTTRLLIDSGGRVGINQTPLGNNFALQVTGLGGASGDARAVYLKGSGAHTSIGGTGPTLVLQNTNSTANNIVKLSFESASAGETISINAINTNHSSHYGDMAFNTRGSSGYSEKMRIMANGNVGIGTDDPQNKLHVNGGSIRLTDTQGFFLIPNGNSNSLNGNYFTSLGGGSFTHLPFVWRLAGANRMVLDTAGQLGIGNANPNRPLTITANSGANTLALRARSNDDYAFVQFWNNAGTALRGQIYNHNGNIGFTTGTDSSAGNDLYLKDGGNVGIGTDNPDCALDVTRTTGWAEMHLDGASGGDLILKDNGVSYGEIYAGNGHGFVLKSYAGQDMYFLTNAEATVKMVIEDGGNVGIGEDQPAYKLDVLHSSTPIAQFKGATNAYFDLGDGTVNTRFQNSGGFYLGTTTNHDIHFKANNQTKLSINTSGAVTTESQGQLIGNKWINNHENIYWNSKLISSSGYGNAPDKWYTQGAVTITSEHPYNKGFSTQYTNTQSASHTTNINNATPSTPYWGGVYTTFPGATNFSGSQNSSIGGGWENGEGAIMKMVYDGSGSVSSTNAVRANIWKNFFSAGALELRMSFFYFIESGQFSSGYFAGYNGYVGNTNQNFDVPSERHLFTNLQSWTYINHAGQSYLGATYQQSSQNYMNGFGFTPGIASVVWIAIPSLTTVMRNDGKTHNIHSATQQIGQG